MDIPIFLIFIFVSSVSSQEWIVNTEYGDVRGYWSEQYQVWRFVGIPYAKPPLGELRHRAPEPPTPWTGVFDAINDTVSCHTSSPQEGYPESEDCLVINIFVPESARVQGSAPVLFFNHGGGFVSGNGNRYNPYHTTRHGVILITFNYRLGPFGFLCLGTERVPGNAGLKDALAALRWSHNNVVSFGGDPNSLTIYGESAGASMVEALVLSKASEGLFQRVILESGSALSTMANNHNRLGFAKALGIDLGLTPVDDITKLEDLFENIDAQELKLRGSQMGTRSSLCIEREIDGIEAVVLDSFLDTLKSDDYVKYPIIYAYTEYDGMVFTSSYYDIIEDLNSNFEKHMPIDISFPTSAVKEEVVDRIKSFYFGDGGPVDNSDASLLGYIYYFSDRQFITSMLRSSLLYSENSDNPVYLMEFSYRGGFNQPNVHPQFPVASHADIVAHVMDIGYSSNDTIEADQIIRDLMTEMWTNFVKYGDPTPENASVPIRWLSFTKDDQYYLNVNTELSIRQFPFRERLQLWTKIYELYHQPPPRFEVPTASGSNSCTGSITTIFVFIFSLFLKCNLV